MRVLTFLHSFEPGGVERVALRLVRRWREQGIDAQLMLGRDEGAMREDVGSGMEFTTPAGPGCSTASWETLWMILTLPGFVYRLRPDVLFCAGNTYMIVAVALKLLLGEACPPILAKISNDLDRRYQPWWERLFYRLWLRIQGQFIDHVVAMDSPMRDEIREALGLPPEDISIIPDPALSHDLIHQLRTKVRKPCMCSTGRRFVAVGRLAPQKNFGLMLRAFARGASTKDTLTLVGEGPERSGLTRLAEQLDLEDRVFFQGYVSEPAAMLRQFDVLLLSSSYEGVPAVVLEALAAKLEIVATNCSRSMAGILKYGLLGQLVPVDDEDALTDAIALVRPGLQNASLSLAQAERFTLENASAAYLEALAEVHRRASEARFFHALTEVSPLARHQSHQTETTIHDGSRWMRNKRWDAVRRSKRIYHLQRKLH